MTISPRANGHVTILDLAGRMTVESSTERVLALTVRHFLDEGHRQILLNLEGVPQIDSSGLSQLVEAYTTTTRQGGQLKFVYVTRHVDALLRITHMDRVFETFHVEAEAVASFSAHGGSRA